MRKLIVIATLMLLRFAGSALGQHRIVKLNSSQVQGREPKANSITVIWDDGEGRHRRSSILIEGPVRFVTRDVPSPYPESPIRYLDGVDGSVAIFLSALPHFSFSQEEADTILGYQTALIQAGPTAIYYSKKLGTDLKTVIVTKDDAVETSQAVSIDQQADFDPRTVDLSAIEEAAAKAEAAGQGDYAKQIRRLIRRWERAAANWP